LTTPDSILNDLDKIGRKEVVRRLHNLYSTVEDKNARIKILKILNNLQDNTHFEEIENYFLSDEDPEVRIEAAKLLAFNYDDKKAIKPLIWVLENENKREIKHAALRLLVAFVYRKEFKQQIVDCLKKLLSNPDDELKMNAIESLGIIKEQSAIDDLLGIVNSPNRLVRIRAIQALGTLKSKKAIPKLIDNLKLESHDMWKFAFNALKKIVGKENLIKLLLENLASLEEIREDAPEALLKRGVMKALGELGDNRAVLDLINSLKDQDYSIREEAKGALDKIEPEWREKRGELLKRKYINI
jgi:HEAT repeat protein